MKNLHIAIFLIGVFATVSIGQQSAPVPKFAGTWVITVKDVRYEFTLTKNEKGFVKSVRMVNGELVEIKFNLNGTPSHVDRVQPNELRMRDTYTASLDAGKLTVSSETAQRRGDGTYRSLGGTPLVSVYELSSDEQALKVSQKRGKNSITLEYKRKSQPTEQK